MNVLPKVRADVWNILRLSSTRFSEQFGVAYQYARSMPRCYRYFVFISYSESKASGINRLSNYNFTMFAPLLFRLLTYIRSPL